MGNLTQLKKSFLSRPACIEESYYTIAKKKSGSYRPKWLSASQFNAIEADVYGLGKPGVKSLFTSSWRKLTDIVGSPNGQGSRNKSMDQSCPALCVEDTGGVDTPRHDRRSSTGSVFKQKKVRFPRGRHDSTPPVAVESVSLKTSPSAYFLCPEDERSAFFARTTPAACVKSTESINAMFRDNQRFFLQRPPPQSLDSRFSKRARLEKRNSTPAIAMHATSLEVHAAPDRTPFIFNGKPLGLSCSMPMSHNHTWLSPCDDYEFMPDAENRPMDPLGSNSLLAVDCATQLFPGDTRVAKSTSRHTINSVNVSPKKSRTSLTKQGSAASKHSVEIVDAALRFRDDGSIRKISKHGSNASKLSKKGSNASRTTRGSISSRRSRMRGNAVRVSRRESDPRRQKNRKAPEQVVQITDHDNDETTKQPDNDGVKTSGGHRRRSESSSSRGRAIVRKLSSAKQRFLKTTSAGGEERQRGQSSVEKRPSFLKKAGAKLFRRQSTVSQVSRRTATDAATSGAAVKQPDTEQSSPVTKGGKRDKRHTAKRDTSSASEKNRGSRQQETAPSQIEKSVKQKADTEEIAPQGVKESLQLPSDQLTVSSSPSRSRSFRFRLRSRSRTDEKNDTAEAKHRDAKQVAAVTSTPKKDKSARKSKKPSRRPTGIPTVRNEAQRLCVTVYGAPDPPAEFLV